MLRTQTNFLLGSLAFTGLVLCACHADQHTIVEPKDGTVIVCTACYNEVYQAQHPTGSRFGATVTQTHTRHMCPYCRTEISIYTESGVTKVKCSKCAPEGVACDKCLPPKDWSPPKTAAEPTTN